MLRKIIKIDEEKCNGCGLCAIACHEGAIAIINGKAKLLHENYCDGLGDCLPQCPQMAISFEERDAMTYDEAQVLAAKKQKNQAVHDPIGRQSQLMNWPCQIKLAPIQAPYFHSCRLLIAADCTAYAYASIHDDFMKDRITLIGCPKLDGINYSEKLSALLANNDIEEILVLRMEVPCCQGLENAVKKALDLAKKKIPTQCIVLSSNGKIVKSDQTFFSL